MGDLHVDEKNFTAGRLSGRDGWAILWRIDWGDARLETAAG